MIRPRPRRRRPLRAVASIAGHSPILQVNWIRVELVADSPICAADARELSARTEGPDGQALLSALSALLEELHETAQQVVSGLTEWARIQGRQHWLGINGEAPYGLNWADLVDLDANEVLPVDKHIGPVGTIRIVDARQVLDREQVTLLPDVLGNPPSPSLPGSLLADAFYYAREATPPDLPRALLIAAVACEVKIKGALRDRVAPEAADLLELALRNTRPTVALFATVCKEGTDLSLSDHDDGTQYKKLAELFRRRNDLAHHGSAPGQAQVYESLQAATDAFRWLDAFPKMTDRPQHGRDPQVMTAVRLRRGYAEGADNVMPAYGESRGDRSSPVSNVY